MWIYWIRLFGESAEETSLSDITELILTFLGDFTPVPGILETRLFFSSLQFPVVHNLPVKKRSPEVAKEF